MIKTQSISNTARIPVYLIFVFLKIISKPAILTAVCLGLSFSVWGQNLYTGDTSAETETDTLTWGSWSSGLVKYVWDDTTAFHGQKSIRIDRDGVRRFHDPSWKADDLISVKDSPALTENQPYTISFYAKASEADFPLNIMLRPSAGWRFYVPKGNYDKQIKLTTKWQRYSITFTPYIKDNAPTQSYSLTFDFRKSPQGKIWYDALQIERGNSPTPYKNASQLNVGVDLNSNDDGNIYFADQDVVATVYTTVPDGTNAVLQCKVIDYKSDTIKEFRQPVNNSGAVSLPLKINHLGWFKIIASLTDDAKNKASHSTNFIRILKPVASIDRIPPFSGIIESPGYVDSFSALKRIGVKRIQVKCSWRNIETKPGEFNWRDFDFSIKHAKSLGFKTKVGINPLTSIPLYLFDPKEVEMVKKLQNRSWLVLDRSKHELWRNFIAEVMRRYGDLIDSFELGGEDNGTLGHNAYYKSLYPEHVKDSFLCGGKPFDDLCNMIKVGAKEIRKTHPQMRIGAIRPSQGRIGENWIFVEEMFKVIGKDFNIFPVDTYLAVPYDYGPDLDNIQRRGTLEGRFYTYNLAKSYTKKYGCDQPIYISESGTAIDYRYPDESIYRRQQAEMLVKDFITSRVAGFYAYDWFMGMGRYFVEKYNFFMTENGKIQSATAAYSAAAQIVENVTETKWLTPDRITRIAVLRKHDGKGIAAIWADDGYTLRLPEEQANHLTVTDMMGNVLPYGNGAFALTSAPLCIKHDNYNALCDIMGKAKIDLTEWGQIKFRMITPKLGRIQFVNLSNTVDLEINAVISVGGVETTKIVNVPRGSTNSCNIALKGDAPIDVKASIEGSDSKLTASFTPNTPVDIGQGNDAQSKIASIQANNDILPNEPWVPWNGTDDLSANIFSSWDEDYLYLRFVVKDDVNKNKFEQPWGGDSIQVAIDPKNNAAFFDRKGNNIIGPDHFEFGMALNDDGKIIYKHAFGKELCIPDDYSVVRDEKAGTTTYSLRMPWKKLKVKPYSGMVFGMSFVVFDDDDGTGQSYYGFIGGGITGALGGKNAALYKKFVLK